MIPWFEHKFVDNWDPLIPCKGMADVAAYSQSRTCKLHINQHWNIPEHHQRKEEHLNRNRKKREQGENEEQQNIDWGAE